MGFNEATAKLNQKDYVERQVYKTEGGEPTFEERKEKAMEKVSQILDNANMAAIANSLLEKNSFPEVDEMSEEDLEKTCDPYDAAVIVAICKKIELNKLEAKDN